MNFAPGRIALSQQVCERRPLEPMAVLAARSGPIIGRGTSTAGLCDTRQGDEMTSEQQSAAPSASDARSSSWGGPGVRTELRRIAEDAGRRAGFRVCAIEVLRTDGLVELVAMTGVDREERVYMGQSYPHELVREVLSTGTPYGKFVFLPEEDMRPELQEGLGSYGYIPPEGDPQDPQRWRPLDMLVAALTDASDRTRALLHLDEPLSGRRPPPAELHDVAARLELALQAVLVTVDREELTRRARLDETARVIVRAASRPAEGDELLAAVHAELVAGFRAHSVEVLLFDDPPDSSDAGASVLPAVLRPAVEAATRRAWESRTVIIAEPGRVWGDDRLEKDHLQALTDHLGSQGAGELLLVPIGAGDEPMGVLTVVRVGGVDRWTEGESLAALGVGHDLGRALLSTRSRQREQQLVDQLQRLDEYRQELIATVSHELKNPLGVIVGHVEMLGSVDGLPSAAATSVAALARGSSRLVSLVDDLLLLSQVGNAERPIADQQIYLGTVLANVVEDESTRAAKFDVTLRIEALTGVSSCVPGEPEELRQVITNIVSNAVKYSRVGGTVDLSLEDRGDEVVFTCSDTGLGISEQDREHLFTEFFRSTDPEALRRPGTGLGLAIVSRIVARHAGRIEVDTEFWKGTTLRIFLPRPRG